MERASPANAMPSTNEWTRVVVLTPPSSKGHGMTEGLKRLFAARDWFAVEQHDPYLAMAELCLRERAQVARSAWGLQRMELIALVVMQPEQWPQLHQLVNAVHQFVPSATIWSAAEDDSISPLNGVASAPTRPPIPKAPASVPASTPVDEVLPTLVAEAKQTSTTIESQRISREEIVMLLDMEWSDASEIEGRP
jgi:hypothetical protein